MAWQAGQAAVLPTISASSRTESPLTVMFRMAIGDEAREESRLDLHQARLIVYSQHTPCSQELRESHKIVIGDAMHTQRELSKQSIQARGDFVWVVKMNQPTLHEDLATLGGNRSSRPQHQRSLAPTSQTTSSATVDPIVKTVGSKCRSCSVLLSV